MENQVTTFLGVSSLVIVTPGPDMALTVRNALLGGRKQGVSTAVGVAAGLTLWAAATSLGLTALIRASEQGFVAIKLIGATYLVLLGARTLYAVIGSTRQADDAVSDSPSRSVSASAALRQGIASNLLNPTAGVFFLSVLPQLIPNAGTPWPALLLFGLAFALLTLSWLTTCALLVARAGEILFGPVIRRALQGMTGVTLVALGLRLALEAN